MTSYQELRAEIEEKQRALQHELKAAGEKYFAIASTKLFEEYPDLRSFSWSQYTPYFNDGDACVFSVRSEYGLRARFKGDPFADRQDRQEWEAGTEYCYLERPFGSGTRNAVDIFTEKLSDIIGAVDEDTMRHLFGDHVTVTISRDGEIQTEVCEHD